MRSLVRAWTNVLAKTFFALGVMLALPAPSWSQETGSEDFLRDYRPSPCKAASKCALGAVYDPKGDIVDDQVYSISYGNADTTYNVLVSGRAAAFACESRAGLDIPGFTLTGCEVQPVLLPSGLGGFTKCTPNQWGFCGPTMAPHHFRVARFGNGSIWIYQFVASEFACPADGALATTNDFNGMQVPNPHAWGTRCEVSNNTIPAAPRARWTTCSAEFETCSFPSAGSYLVRYGAHNTFYYRLMSGTGVRCSATAFRMDPAVGSVKRCDYLELPKIAKVTGSWEIAGTCENCTNANYEVVTGVVQGNTKSAQSSWSFELSEEISFEGELSPVSGSISSSQTWSASNLVSDSFSKEESTTLTVGCDLGVLWQWVTSVQNYCLPNSGSTADCVSVARSKLFQCLRPGVSPGVQPIQLNADSTPPTGLSMSDACVAKWSEMGGGPDQASATVATALNVPEYKVDPDGDYTVTVRNWAFLCPSLLAQ